MEDWTEEDEQRLQRILARAAARKKPDQGIEDLILAIGLLEGAWTQQGANQKDRFPDKRYYSGKLEEEARQAIGRLLRSNKPLDGKLSLLLAELFDGEPPHLSFDAAPVARKIVFQARRAGKMNETALKYLHIADEYYRLRKTGTPPKKATGLVCDKFGVKETTVKKARRARDKLTRKGVQKAR